MNQKTNPTVENESFSENDSSHDYDMETEDANVQPVKRWYFVMVNCTERKCAEYLNDSEFKSTFKPTIVQETNYTGFILNVKREELQFLLNHIMSKHDIQRMQFFSPIKDGIDYNLFV